MPTASPVVRRQCPGQALCRNPRLYTHLNKHLNAAHRYKHPIPARDLAASGFQRCPAPECGKYFRLGPSGAPAAHSDDEAVSVASFRTAPSSLPLTSTAAPPSTPVTARAGTAAVATPRRPVFVREEDVQEEAMTEQRALEIYAQAAPVQSLQGVLPSSAARDWTAVVDRLAERFLNSTDGGLAAALDIPDPPVPAPRDDHDRGTFHGPAKPTAETVRVAVSRGRLRRAARHLGPHSGILPLSDSVVASLRSKYPPAHTRRGFERTGAPAPPQLQHLDATAVRVAVRSFRKDLAVKSDKFCEFILQLARGMGNGTAPLRLVFSSAQLLPLAKPNGDVRPIAIGELIYRLCAKLLISALPLSDSLLPNQLGPVVRLMDLLVDGRLPEFTHVLLRRSIDKGIQRFCPSLYRFAQWRYGHSNTLLASGAGKAVMIEAHEGVLQGDPFGPFFFSRLQESLGPDHLIQAGALARIQEFFRADTESDCSERTVDDIRRDVVGSAEARRNFLRTIVDAEIAKLEMLPSLRRQDALLLLTQCVQHNLRHLLRTLRTDDIPGAWDYYGQQLHAFLRRMRSNPAGRTPFDSILFSLPVRQGGCGVLLPSDLAPLARAASIQAATRFLRDTLGIDIIPFSAEDDTDGDGAVSQRERCQEFYSRLAAMLLDHSSFDRAHQVAFEANKARLARRWFSAIPFSPKLCLSDRAVQFGLALRTLATTGQQNCPRCYAPPSLGHYETCRQRDHHYIRRHNAARDALARALRSAPETRVIVEPRVEEPAPNGAVVEVDLTFTSLATQAARQWLHHSNSEAAWQRGSAQGAKWCTEQHLEMCAREKCKKYVDMASTDFVPLVFSLDGIEAKDTHQALQHWRLLIPSFPFLLDELSVLLLVTRAASLL
ncbi:hypothetical protein V8E36_004366 [Tilletia maclaganii]